MLNLINMSENYNIYTYDFNSSIYSGKHNFTPPTSIGILNIPTNSASDKYLPIETTHVKHELLRTKTKLLPETKQSYEDLCQSISQYNIKYSKRLPMAISSELIKHSYILEYLNSVYLQCDIIFTFSEFLIKRKSSSAKLCKIATTTSAT